jgi:hypothetical protein
MSEHLEGWCTDPFGRHEARWISARTPTRLVRDGGTESYDEPPDEAPSQVAEPIITVGGPDSTRRADDAQSEYFDRQRAIDAAETGVDVGFNQGYGTPHIWRPAKRRRRGDDRLRRSAADARLLFLKMGRHVDEMWRGSTRPSRNAGQRTV